jgi:hypothetical protein
LSYHNRADIIILNKQQKLAYLLDMAVPNSHNITQTYNTKINKYLELSVVMRNLWCLEKISILPLIISAMGIIPQSLFKNLKILDLDNKLVVEIQNSYLCIKGIIRRLWHEGMFKARGTRAFKFLRAIIDNYAIDTYNVLFYFIISKRFKQIFRIP